MGSLLCLRVGFLLWFLFVSSFLIYFRLYLTSHSLTCDFFCQHLKSQGLMVLFVCNVYLQSFITSCLSDISANLNNVLFLFCFQDVMSIPLWLSFPCFHFITCLFFCVSPVFAHENAAEISLDSCSPSLLLDELL